MAPARSPTLPYLRLSHYLTLGNRCACGVPWPCLVAVTLDQAQVVEDRASAYEAALWAVVLAIPPADHENGVMACPWCLSYWPRVARSPAESEHAANCPWQIAWDGLVAHGDEDELAVRLAARWEVQQHGG